VNPRASGAVPGPETPIRRICHDHREVGPGSLFVCLRGRRNDGHDLAAEALRSGALLVIGERLPMPGVTPYVQVDDSRRALALLACAFHGHPSRDLLLAGVTGTNGKTSVTWMIDAALRECGFASAVMGTLGRGTPAYVRSREEGPETPPNPARDGFVSWLPNPFTTPEAPELQGELARWRDSGVKAGAMEVSSHALALRRSYGTRFACVVFTNLSPDHLDFHGSMESYAAAKRLLFRRAERGPEEPRSTAVLNADDPASTAVSRGTDDRILRFGRSAEADVRVEEVEMSRDGIRVRIRIGGAGVEVRSPLLGSFQVDNLLAAEAAACALGLDPARAAAGLGRLRGVPGRMERVDCGQAFPVLVDYAHTPAALQRACESLRPFTTGRLLLLFGCGGDRDRSKRPLMGEAAARGADWCVLTDDNPRTEDPAEIRAQARSGLEAHGARFVEEGDREKAIGLALASARPGDVVLIAGKGHEGVQIRGTETIPFDDRRVAARLLGARVG
jgi:UDP-N-acetylmuramoyl-L-alanyl-D-glutamate--2,6-diaminopimelate ligase